MIDARYEKARTAGTVTDVAVLVAIGMALDGKRHLLGVTVALSATKVHWQKFLEHLVTRRLHGGQPITSDGHAVVRGAIRTVFLTATWQHRQFHLGRNAQQRAPKWQSQARIAHELRVIWKSPTLFAAGGALAALVARYRITAPAFARWLVANVPAGLGVFSQPAPYWVHRRTTNMFERAVRSEVKHRTRTIRPFPNVVAVERLVTAVLMNIDQEWQAEPQPHLHRSV